MKKSHEIIGVKKCYIGDFEDGDFGNENHRDIVKFIEKAIADCQPEYIFTNHKNDLNYDHFITAKCCEEAARYSHRGIYLSNELIGFFYMNTISETDWRWGNDGFNGVMFAQVDEEDVEKKIEALNVYEGVVRRDPHPRSPENIMANAKVKGSRCKSIYAEEFEVAYLKWN